MLGQIPVERATEVILARIKAGQPVGEIELVALSDIGSAAAIEPLYQLWKPGDVLLAEHLLTLCELNGVQKPELAEWRRLVIAEDERLAKIMSSESLLDDIDPLETLQKLGSSEQPLIRTWQLESKQPKTPSGRQKKVQPAMAEKHRCKRDGFPMRKIKGQWECVAEYIDRCAGQQRIVDVIEKGETVYYVFENGHKLPLLCSCCGGALDINVEQDRHDKVGLRLKSMSINYEVDDGQQIEELLLEFSRKGWLSQKVGIPVSFDVAVRMSHPAHCPHRTRRQAPARSATSRPKKKKRRRRKLPGRN